MLKFAEHMVGVYNLKTGHMSRDLDFLEAGEKVVVFKSERNFRSTGANSAPGPQWSHVKWLDAAIPQREKQPAPSKP